MSFFPIRNLAKYGVLTDPDPYDLPTEAWSFGANVRFLDGKVVRGPVFRGVTEYSGQTDPRFIVGTNPVSGLDLMFICFRNGRVYRFQAGSLNNYSIAAYADSAVEGTWTTARLANIIYINRDDRPPWYMAPSGSQFTSLAAGGGPAWHANWTTKLLRSCSSALVALNVTKGGVNFPTMVKTSGFPTSGNIPASWDETVPATNATENILSEMEGAIIDAQTLRNEMYIYGQEETWLMTFVSGTDIWDYRKVFNHRGAINANCVVEINGKHIVFGTDDIWQHDGVSAESIADGRVRQFIYGALNATQASQCFIVHNALLKELMFCFVSGDRFTAFTSTDGCNRSATWNYERNVWTSFDDLPFVYHGARANLDQTLLYSTATQTYADIGGSYLSQEDTFRRSLVFVGATNATYGLTGKAYAFDPVGPLSQVSYSVDTTATKNMYLERDGIDLDQVGADLVGYKVCQSIVPQGRLDAAAPPLQFTLGAADYFNQAPAFAAYQTWDGASLYKLDYGQAGRYLAMRILFPDYNFVSISGFDADLDVLGER